MHSLKIVIADDDVATLRLLEKLVGKTGYEVLGCTNGDDAFDRVVEHQPVILLADWEMPGLTGVQLCEKIRATQPQDAAYIILLTGNDRKEHVVAGFKSGADDYVIKPAHTAELLARIRAGERLLGLMQQEAERSSELTQIIESNPSGILIVDGETGTVSHINSAACHILGLQSEQILGHPCCRYLCPSGENLCHGGTLGQPVDKIEGLIRRVDGRNVPVIRSVVPVVLDGRKCRLENFIDISAMKEGEEQRVRQAMITSLMHRVTAMAADARSFDATLQNAIDMICETIGWPVGHVYAPAMDGTDELKPTGIWHLDEPIPIFVEATEKTRFGPGVGLPGRILKSQKPAWIANVQTDPNFPRARLADDIGVKGALGFPIIIAGEVVGVLEFFSRQEMLVDEGMLEVMHSIGEQIGRVFERRLAEKQLRLQGAALDAAANAIVIADTNGFISWSNSAFSSLTGYSVDEVIGQHTRLLKSGEYDQAFYEDLWNTVLSGEVWHGELINRKKDGTLYPEEMTITPVRDDKGKITSFIAIKQDISIRKQAEAELRRLSSFPESNPHPILELRRDGRVNYRNPFTRSLVSHLGLPPDKLDQILPDDYLALIEACIQNEQEISGQEKEYAGRIIGWTFCYVPGAELVHAYGVDITEQRKAEAERQKQAVLEQERNHLRDAVNAHERVLGVVGHELRTPLAGVRAMAEFLLDENAREMAEFDTFLRNIHDEVVRMSGMVNDMLEVARMNSGAACWNWGEVSMYEACEAAMNTVRTLVDQDKVKLILDVQPAQLMMKGDADAIRRLVLNLLNNACKNTPEGSIRVEAHGRETNGHRWVEVEVSDTGQGMTQEIANRLGEAFALNSGVVGENHVKGSGLGLSICKGIAAAHGGSICVNTEVGSGTTLTVVLRADLIEPMSSDKPAEIICEVP